MKRISDIFISKLLLAFAAVFLSVSAQVQLDLKPDWHPFLLGIFAVVFFEYNRVNIFKLVKEIPVVKKNHFRSLTFQLAFYLIMGLYFLLIMPATPRSLFVIFIPGILTFLYISRGYSNRIRIFRLREIPYLKIFVITFVWTWTTILIPVTAEGINSIDASVVELFAQRFLFIFAITIQFDIRDMKADRQAELKTLPLLLGHGNAKLISVIALIISFIVSVFSSLNAQNTYVLLALVISVILTLFFITRNEKAFPGKYYYHFLDGALLFQGVLVLMFYFFS